MEMEPDSSQTVTDLRPGRAGYRNYMMLLDFFEMEAEAEAEAEEVIYTDRPSLHKHRLAFSNNFNSGGDCAVCKQQITGPHYFCPSCPKLFIHNYPCFEVSDHIQRHPFHPQHTLTLSHSHAASEDLCCGVCSNDFDADGGYVYSCDECTFYMDVKCASLSLTNCKSLDHQPSQLHPHPLILCDQNKNFCYKCTCCELPIEIEGSSLYACLQCRALLHKSCADLPQKMKHRVQPCWHPLVLLYGCNWFTCRSCHGRMQGFWYHCSKCNFYMDVHCTVFKPARNNKCYKLYADLPQQIDHLLHPQHFLRFCHSSESLNLESLNLDQTLTCGACLRSSRGFFFECQWCGWYIDVGCALAMYTPMMSKIHPHPLIFFDKANNLFECNSCGQCCYTPFFRCFRCDFNLHVHCVSILPRTLKYNNHVHPLTLTNSPIKDHADEDDNAEFYCGACEELRVLADPSYYCEECTYVAHPHCIVSKNISILEEECSKVESDTSGSECLQEECSGQESNVSGTECLEEECSEQDSNASGSECVQEPPSLTVKEFLDSFDWIDKSEMESLSQYYNVIEYYRRSGFSRLDEIIEPTIRNFESDNHIKVPWQDWDPTSKIVPVGEYMILEDWAPILRALIAKYGDFGCNCRWTPKMKMLCMMAVCDAISHMCSTKVEYITADLLLSWYWSLRIGLAAKFRIRFAFDRLTKVARAHLGINAHIPTADEVRELEMKLKSKRTLQSLGLDCRPDAVKLKGQTAGLGLL
ncbi:Diacylglycerol kinase [Actinidia chinensis var. chinensis]|uniref:Diacylglycerol kinase n=1 Tax=Actinidia chinensis var. chinensis TaxID=1590841 RepID=A0A2R6PYG9_ACTCC|nr:Diacylglycerol kinase [Actinidia chinensis var. chinensis]